MTRKYVVTLEDTLKGWQEDEDELERKYGAEPLNCDNCEIVQASIDTGIKTASRLVNDILGKIRAEIEQEYNRLSATRVDETLELGECLGLKMSLKIIDKYKSERSKE